MPQTNEPGEAAGVTRRDLLGAGSVLTTGLVGGCLQRVRNLVDRPAAEQLSLEIKTLPAEADQPATQIARLLADHLETVGIDTNIVLLREDELRRDVLTKRDFEVYVDQMPLEPDPDFLRPRLHSVFAGNTGWQNPFGLTNLELDEDLEEQRFLEGDERRRRIYDAQERIARLQPFVAVAVPNEIGAIRTDRFTNWAGAGLSSSLSYLTIRSREEGLAERLRVTTTDQRATRNLNPIDVTFRDRGTITGLLYESLGRRVAGDVQPWLATEWEWRRTDGTTTVEVTLREDLTWHDGSDLTAEDVAFTYRFLQDTTLGDGETPVPAPRFRGPTTLVEEVTVEGPETLRIDVGETTAEVGARALTVPILPEHVWRDMSVEAELAGVDVNQLVTEALVWANPEPVGSGPLAFERRTTDEELVLQRYDDHFLHDEGEAENGSILQPYVANGADFAELVVRVAPSTSAAVELVADAEADATVPTTDPDIVPRIAVEDDISLFVDKAPSLYQVGFNARIDPLVNPNVRRTIARILDKEAIVEDVFDGHAVPAASPLEGTDWIAPDLRWNGQDPEVPFDGTDGELDAERVRDRFRDFGFQYQDGRLLEQ